MERRGCLYFAEQASPRTGQVLDRASGPTAPARSTRRMASIAATGFGLTALCIADKRGYQPTRRCASRCAAPCASTATPAQPARLLLPLQRHRDRRAVARQRGLLHRYRAAALRRAHRARALSRRRRDRRLATTIYERVDWPWMLNGGKTFSMGLERRVPELALEPLLRADDALPARHRLAHPPHRSRLLGCLVPALMRYAGFDYISAADPLFVHQYSHAWFDFRNKRDRYADYFANSILATRAHQAFCLSLGKPYSRTTGASPPPTRSTGTPVGRAGRPRCRRRGLRRHRWLGRSLCDRRFAAVSARRLPARAARAEDSTANMPGDAMASATPSIPTPSGTTPTCSASTLASAS